MSTDFPQTAPAAPAAPAPETAPAPAAPPAAPEPTAVDYRTHPVWGEALASLPDVLAKPVIDTISKSEAHAQKAIEDARAAGVPEEWRELYAEAERQGVTVESLAAAYRGQQQLSNLLQNDPDAFVASLNSQIDALVAAGRITRREGAAAKAEGQQLAEQTDDLLTDDQKQLRELQQWREQQEARNREQEQQRQQQQLEQQAEQEEQQFLGQFYGEFGQQMVALGIGTIVNGEPMAAAGVDPALLETIATRAGSILDQNQRISVADAIKQSVETQRRIIESTGGRLGGTPAAAGAPPVVGGTAHQPAGGVQRDPSQPRTDDERREASLAEIARMLAS